MRQSEQAPLVAEDVETGDFSDDVEEVTGTSQRARSRTMCRTTLAIFMFGALATMVVVGPVDNPLHASPEFSQKWSLSGMWESAKEKYNEVKTHVDESGWTDTIKEHASNAYEWSKGKAEEYWKHAEAYMDEHLSPETRAWMKEKIEAIKGLPAWAKQKGEEIFCEVKKHLADVKARLREKILKDFADKNSECGKDFQSQKCRDEMVADACKDVGAMSAEEGNSVAGFNLNDILNAPKNFCEVTFQEIVKHIQEHFVDKVDMIKQHQAMAQGNAHAETLLRTSIDVEMGEVDTEVNKICSRG